MELEELDKSKKPVLVDFYADWCGACQSMKPVLGDLKEKMGDEFEIINIDVDKYPKMAKTFKIRNIPTLILYKNGEMLWRQSGMASRKDLETLIRKHNS